MQTNESLSSFASYTRVSRTGSEKACGEARVIKVARGLLYCDAVRATVGVFQDPEETHARFDLCMLNAGCSLARRRWVCCWSRA